MCRLGKWAAAVLIEWSGRCHCRVVTFEQRLEGKGVLTAWRPGGWNAGKGEQDQRKLDGDHVGQWFSKCGFRITNISFTWFDSLKNIPLRSPSTGSIAELSLQPLHWTAAIPCELKLLSTGYSQPVTKPGRTLKQACSWETHLETLCRASAAAFLSFPLESCYSRRHYRSPSVPPSLTWGQTCTWVWWPFQPLLPPHFFHKCSPEKSLAYFGIYFLEDSG